MSHPNIMVDRAQLIARYTRELEMCAPIVPDLILTMHRRHAEERLDKVSNLNLPETEIGQSMQILEKIQAEQLLDLHTTIYAQFIESLHSAISTS